MKEENKRIISIRRHAKTSKSAIEASSSERVVSPEGREACYELGRSMISEKIIDGYTASHLRSQQTLFYLMDGSGHLDLEKMFVEQSLNEPHISPDYRKIINADERERDERIAFFLTNQDKTGKSTTPYQAACATSNFIATTNKLNSDSTGRIEAITNAPKLECFLQVLEEDAFAKHLEGKFFDYLEGIELRVHKELYIVSFRDKEMQVPGSRLIDLANQYT